MPTFQETIDLIQTTDAQVGSPSRNGKSVFLDSIAVFMGLPIWASEDLCQAALCRHLIEYTKETRETLLARGYSARTVDIVEAVANDKLLHLQRPKEHDMTAEQIRTAYAAKVDKIIASGDKDAITLMFCDLSERYNSSALLADFSLQSRQQLIDKYDAPYQKLRKAFRKIDQTSHCDTLYKKLRRTFSEASEGIDAQNQAFESVEAKRRAFGAFVFKEKEKMWPDPERNIYAPKIPTGRLLHPPREKSSFRAL